jgi:hypothetical protein
MKHFVPTLACLCLAFFVCRPSAGAQITTSAVNPSTVASVAYSGSSFPWTNPAGAAAAGGPTATSGSVTSILSGNSEYLEATDFGFAIPLAATVSGVTVYVTRVANGLSLTLLGTTVFATVEDHAVSLTGVPVASSNLAQPGTWGGATTTVSYGGAFNSWGTTLTPPIVNSSAFGVDFAVTFVGNTLLGLSLLPNATVDVVTMSVSYTMSSTLPVRLDQWSVVRQGSANILRWSGAVTHLPGQFIIERSSNGRDWSDWATVGGAVYSYADNAPFASGPTYYRLRLHSDGEADGWSSIQAISVQLLRPVVILYPNPFHDIINIVSPHSFGKLSLKDLQGKTLFVKEYAGGGVSNAQIPVSGLAAGIYFVQVDGVTYKLIKN